MPTIECTPGAFNRRAFLMGSTGAIMGSMVPEVLPAFPLQQAGSRHIMGPVAGYSPLLGTLVSMMNWIRPTVIRAVEDLNQEELDYLYDSEANTIGALLLHLAATEVWYQRNTLGRRGFTAEERKEWRTASNLGAEARATIKGHPLDYYLSRLEEVDAWTLEEFRRRDDDWLAEVDPSFFDGQPTNNFAKWFHVVEHEGNHRGQITWLRKRLPGHEFADAVRGG